MNYGHGSPLRADPMKLMVPQIRIEVGNPSWVPRMVVPAELEAYVPGIISLIQIEVESKIGQGPLRMHAHNLVAANNFQNEHFVELVDIILKFIHAQMLSGSFNSIQQAVNALVGTVVGMWSAAQVRQYPDLMQYLTPQHQQVAMEAVNQMADVVGLINRAEQGNGYGNNYGQGQQNNGYANNGGSVFNNGNRGGTWARGDGRGDYSAYSPGNRNLYDAAGYAPPGQGPMPSYGRDGGSPLFHSGQRQMPMDHQTEMPTGVVAGAVGGAKVSRSRIQLLRQQGYDVDDDGNVKQPEQPAAPAAAPQQQQPQQSYAKWGTRTAGAAVEAVGGADAIAAVAERSPAQQPGNWDADFNRLASLETPPPLPSGVTSPAPAPTVELVEPTDEEVGEDHWKPSNRQQYHPAWTSATQKVEYHKLNDGCVLAVVVNMTEQEKKMNENEHAIGVKSIMRTAFARDAQGKVERTEEGPVAAIEPPPVTYAFVNNDDVQMDVSERTTAMIAGVVGRASGLVKNKTDIWHTTTWVVEPVLCANEEVSEYLDQLTTRASECTTFVDLLKVMRELTGQDEVALRNRINQSMTRALNDQLAFNISPKVYLDDFETDIEDGIPHLRKKHGDRIVDALLAQQREIIRTNLLVAQGEDHDTMNTALLGSATLDGKMLGSITYLAARVTHSHMQLTAQELSLAMPRRGVALLTEANTPLLEAVAQEMFSGKFGTAGVVARRFIVTIDGLVLQVARSLLNPSSFLVRVID